MRLRIQVTKDLAPLEARFSDDKLKAAQTRLAMQVGDDSNKFCKEDTRQTHDSMKTSSNFEAGEVSWTTSYANEAYYDPRARKQKNPNATSKWFETAKSQRLENWTTLVRRSLGA